MSHKSEKYLLREEKRQEKKRLREAKRELKRHYREEKRKEKQRRREEKRKLREEFVAKLFNLSLIDTTSSSNEVVVERSDNSNIYYNNINENDVATLRTIFPDCDPIYIRNCLANETSGDERVRKVAEKLLTTTYPKVIPVTPLTPPTAPPLNLTRNSFESPFDEAPPSYEESVGSQSLQPPPLPSRHQRSSSWNGNGTSQTQSGSTMQSISSQISQHFSRGANTASTEITEAFGSTIKTLMDNFKPATVDHACQKYNYIWSRPIPSHFKYKSFSQQFKILPKDKFSIQRGFNQSNYPSKELRYRDISERDWYLFMNGLNSIIGVNSIKGNTDIEGLSGLSVGLKWVSWMNIATMNESLMESNIIALNEYLVYWNTRFFNPRRITVQLIDNRIRSAKKYEQYLLVKSI